MADNFLQQVIMGNTVLTYIMGAASFLAGVIVIAIVKRILLVRLKQWALKSSTKIDDFVIETVERKLLPLGYFAAFYISIQLLNLPGAFKRVVDVVGALVLTYFVVRFVMSLAKYVIEIYWKKKEMDASKRNMTQVMLGIIQVAIWILAAALLLDNLGIKIAPLIAGLGIGGIAIALAAQAILGDLFSCFSIFFDRPFEIGDFIIVGDFPGVVEYIGIKTTRVRSLGGEQVVFSNTDLTNSRVRNYKRMEKRRVVFKLGLTYQTTTDQLKDAKKIITGIIENVEDAVFDRAHFSSYGDFNLEFEIVYYVLSPDYNKYMDIQEEINLKIKEEFENKEIEFAYPTQTLYINKEA